MIKCHPDKIMVIKDDNIPLDARLLSEAIIELNITRRNVSIYPQEHPIVDKSLNHAMEHLQRLFELRDEITLSIAKDTLIIDDYFLDKENPVFRDFALHLSKMDISFIIFIKGVTNSELYAFMKFLAVNAKETSSEIVRENFSKCSLLNLRVEFINYDAFTFDEEATGPKDPDDLIWERYISGAMEDRLSTDGLPDDLKEISPENLAALLNQSEIAKNSAEVKEESYDKVISAYVRSSSERMFSGTEIKKLMDFINNLRPELKKQFLSSAMRNVSKNMDSAEDALKEISAKEVIDLLSQINEQKVAIPDALKNLLNKFSKLDEYSFKDISFRGGLVADDILLSEEIVNLLNEGDFDKYVSETYHRQIRKLLDNKPLKTDARQVDTLKKEFSDEYIDRVYNDTLLRLMSCDIPGFVQEDAYDNFIDLLKQQLQEFIDTGQYAQVLKTLSVLESNVAEKKHVELAAKALTHFHSPEFISLIMESIRIIGRLLREDALKLVDYYGESIISPLIDALMYEKSLTTRSFLISLITHFKEKAAPEAIKRLNDNRWFVQRNMLVILEECIDSNSLPHIRHCCDSDNPKVSLQAIQCLLKAKDDYAVKGLKKHLHSNFKQVIERAVVLSGAFRVKDAVPDLVLLLNKKTISGADINDKVSVVKSLGKIGDPRAVDTLRNVLSSRSILYKGAVENLKKEVHASLSGYPDENVKELIRQENQDIGH